MPRPVGQKLSFSELLVELANAHEKELNELSDKVGFEGREGYVYRGMSKSQHTHRAAGNEKRRHGKLDNKISKDPPRSRHPIGNYQTLFDTMASHEGDTEIVQASKLPIAPDPGASVPEPPVSSSDEALAITTGTREPPNLRLISTREPPNLRLIPSLPSGEPPTFNKASSYEPPSSVVDADAPNGVEQHPAQLHPHAVSPDNLHSTLRGGMERDEDDDEEEEQRAHVVAWLSHRKKSSLIHALQDKWLKLSERCKEPERHGLVAAAIVTPYFQIASAIVICVNAIMISIQADIDMRSLGKEKSSVFEVLELIFLGWYTIELGLKLFVHRLFFFWNEDLAWNVFDLILIGQGLIEIIIASTLGNTGANMTFARLARLLKLSKIFRIFRIVKYLKDLRTMLRSVVSSFISMLWAFLLLSSVVFMTALTFVQLQSNFLIASDEAGTLNTVAYDDIQKQYGSVGKAMLSLFMATNGGVDWIELYTPLEAEDGGISRCALILFIFFWHFSMVNVVTGIVMEKAIVNASPDREDIMLEHRREQERSARELRLLFTELDANCNNEISMIEFIECLKDEAIQSYFASIGLSVRDAHYFFQVLADTVGSDSVPMEDFILHCSHMKGEAMAVDLIELAWEVKSIKKMLCKMTGMERSSKARRSRLSRFGALDK